MGPLADCEDQRVADSYWRRAWQVHALRCQEDKPHYYDIQRMLESKALFFTPVKGHA
jgi:hypothetical protein